MSGTYFYITCWGLLHKIVRFETYLPVGTFPAGWYVCAASCKWPQHFGLSHSHFLQQRGLPYLIWKRRGRAFLWTKLMRYCSTYGGIRSTWLHVILCFKSNIPTSLKCTYQACNRALFSSKLQYVDLDLILILEVVLLITNFPYWRIIRR